MKKILVLLMTLVIGMGSACARDRVTSNVNELPTTARNILKTHFKNLSVNHIKIDEGFFGVDDYEVILENGTEIDFDSDGTLKEVDAGINTVPTSLIHKSISAYVSKNYKNAKIVKYEVKRYGYEVELNDGLEIKFDKNGSFKSIDR